MDAFEWTATGTRWRVYHDGRLTPAVAERVAHAVARDEARWSRFRDDSELARVNRHAGEAVEVSGETLALAEACVHWHEATGGVFQPLVGEALRVDLGRHAVTVPAGTSLDLGGIAKGWIAQRAARALALLAPAGDLLLDAGGDIVAVRGEHMVGVESGGAVCLGAGEGIATTGAPGRPVEATVIAADPVAADVWAKVLALRPERVGDLALAALVVTSDGARATPAWRARSGLIRL